MIEIITTPGKLRRTDRVLLLLSGGLDSALVGLGVVAERVSLCALSIDFVGRPRQEVKASERIAGLLQVRESVLVELPITDARSTRTDLSGTRHEAWLPFRNVIFLGIAAHYATRLDCNIIAMGVRETDDIAYSDASIDALRKIVNALENDGYPGSQTIRALYVPLLLDADSALRSIAARLDPGQVTTVVQTSRSCWRDGDSECGSCVACRTKLNVSRFLGKSGSS